MGSLSDFIEWLATNPWFAIISFVVAILGVVLTAVLYIRSRKVKLPCYAMRSFNIVKDLVVKVKSLEIMYSGEPIRNLTATKMAFWNGGRDTIRREDIASANPLTVRARKGIKIFDAKILHVKNPTNRFTIALTPDQSRIAIGFEYLDKDEGGIIQFLHTGKSKKDVEIAGTLIGVGNPIRKSEPTFLPPRSPSEKKDRRRSYLKQELLPTLAITTLFLILILFGDFSTPTAVFFVGFMCFFWILLVSSTFSFFKKDVGFGRFDEGF